MFKSYLNIALRNLHKHRFFSFINLAGLAIGMAACILIAAYILQEFSYDAFHENKDRIYRLTTEEKYNTHINKRIYTHSALSTVLSKEFSQIEVMVPIIKNDLQFKQENNIVNLQVLYSKQDIFKVLSFPLLKGNAKQVLSHPNSIVISEKLANTYYPGKDPIGAYMITAKDYNDISTTYTITGIMKDIPANSHFKADAIINSGELNTNQELSWKSYSSISQYVLLHKKAKPEQLESGFESIYKKCDFPEGMQLRLQKLSNVHLYSDYDDEKSPTDIRYLYIFLCAAQLILLIASINFVNLTTARSLHRAREVGVRKVLGAYRSQLISQFLAESFLLYILSLLLGLIVAKLMLPWFNITMGIASDTAVFTNPKLVLLVIAMIIGVGLLAGAYPAFYLSAQNPVFVLKGVLKTSMLNIKMRKSLVVVQFTIATVLIIATLIVYNQLQYISNKRLGFDKERLVILPQKIFTKTNVFKQELLAHHGISDVTISGWNPGQSYSRLYTMKSPLDTTKQLDVYFADADFDFIQAMGIELKEGRLFSKGFAADNGDITESLLDSLRSNSVQNREAYSKISNVQSIILNETAVKELSLHNPVGQTLKSGWLEGTVIGIVKDFNSFSLHQKVTPVVLRAYNEPAGHTIIRIRPGDIKESLAHIEKLWKTFYPEQVYEFSFVDEHLRKLYLSEMRSQTLFTAFTFVGIGIAGLGLLGSALFTAQNRTKEIGIRKVLGASVVDILSLLSKDFLKLILLALLIASPIAWYLMSNWLEDFAYHIEISPWMFVLTGSTISLIALLIIIYHSIKAALANPLDSLRSE